MAISTAVQRGYFVYLYDEKGRALATLSTGTGAGDGLIGYTGSSVSIRRGPFIYTYDQQGRQISMTAGG